ncbi:uncharacterized protein LOC127877783 isoform X3 [Dreissena polymorpha]|uniref:uncharacterized protein LOC127877783 isoform X3 n=1 Tax=Dreissena polymorpha TaxID=45954 RepID=UPI0022640044|nr:uncharacterized protein LOC127877783 isoform X3 [Dreissena polymorpha]
MPLKLKIPTKSTYFRFHSGFKLIVTILKFEQTKHLDGNKPFCERKKLTLGKGRVNVCVIQGDLTREQSDVIVCTANKPLDLSKGQVSKNLLEAAGVSMAAELQSLYPHGIDYDEVAVVSSGNLACRNVYFVALPEAGTSGSDDKTLHKTVTMCLERADRSNFRSLSIPALGTGRLKYHPAMVAAEIIQSVEDFSNSKPGTSVKYVNVVVYDKDDDTSFKAFEGEARSRAGRQINHNGVVSSAGAAISSTILAGLRSLSIMRDGVDKIAEQGLDCRLAGHTAMFGQGVYCAESSTKSDQYADPKGMRSLTDRKMLLVRTCLGEPFVTSSPKSYARPPCKSCLEDKCRCSNNQFYDSIIGDGSWNFREFIVYNMTDVYPEYIVTYDRV